MKNWKKNSIAGCVALFIGFGATFGGQGVIKAINSSNNESDEPAQQVTAPITHQRMLLNSLLEMDSFKVEGGLNFLLEDDTAINIGMDFVGDISDFSKIKLEGDASLYLNGINLTSKIGYYDDTIFFNYKENYFYLETEHVLDFVDMLPEYGIGLSLPSELQNLDLNTISEKIDGMKENKSPNGDIYFVLPLSEQIDLYVKTDKNYAFKGIRTDTIDYNGMKINLDLDLRKTGGIILESPRENEDFYKYQDFKPAFNIFKAFYNAFNNKQNIISVNADIKKQNGDAYDDLLNATLDFGYDIDKMAFQLNADIKERDRHHRFDVNYEEKTAYLTMRDTKLSIKTDTIVNTVQYILESLHIDLTEKLLEGVQGLLTSEEFSNVRENMDNLIGTISLNENTFAIELDTDVFGLGMGIITPTIKFNENELESISINNLVVKGFKIDVTISTKEYVENSINKEEYIEFEPALTIVEAVMPLIEQKQFRIEFDATFDSKDPTVNDLTIDGGLQFDIQDGFGYGEATIVDRNQYHHNIKGDMKNKDEFLFSYNDTMNGKFSSKTLIDLYDLVKNIITSPDEHFIELFGEMMDAFKGTPIGKVMDGDYGAILEQKLINSIEIEDDHLSLNVSLAVIGMEDKSCDITIGYHRNVEQEKSYLDSLTISGIEFENNEITFSAYLKDFDDSKEVERLDPYEEYLDFSDIKVLLQLGVNTSKFEYFHFSCNLTLNIKLLIVNINKDIPLDIKIRNDHGNVQVAVEFTEIPVISLVNTNDDYSSTHSRTASLYYENGRFYIKRVDEVTQRKLIFITTDYTVTYSAVYTKEHFMDNIAEIMLQDILGMKDSIYSQIMEGGITSSSSNQIEYEKILKDFQYSENEGKFTFKIDLYALTHVDVLQTLDLYVYEDKATEQLTTVDINLTIHTGINIKIALHLTTLDKQATLTDSNKLTVMDSWIALHSGDTQNQFTKISEIKK